jgi:hypothetical protein
LRCTPDDYRSEFVKSVKGCSSKPWFKSAAEKWLRWTRHGDFPHTASANIRILFCAQRHCAESGSREFFIGVRDAALVAGVSKETAGRLLRKLCVNGQLEKVGERRHRRHAQTYRLIDPSVANHRRTLKLEPASSTTSANHE